MAWVGKVWTIAAVTAAAILGIAAVPAHADTYTDYLVSQLSRDPVYISSFSPMASPSDASEIKRIIAVIPLKTFVIADVAAGPDGDMSDSDLAAILHDQLGGGLFIFSRTEDDAQAVGFGTSPTVNDAMKAAVEGEGSDPTLVQVLQKFVAILLSGHTEQALKAAEQDQQYQQCGPPAWPELSGGAVGASLSAVLVLVLVKSRRRRRYAPRGESLT
jgi:hypothetical protein